MSAAKFQVRERKVSRCENHRRFNDLRRTERQLLAPLHHYPRFICLSLRCFLSVAHLARQR